MTTNFLKQTTLDDNFSKKSRNFFLRNASASHAQGSFPSWILPLMLIGCGDSSSPVVPSASSSIDLDLEHDIGTWGETILIADVFDGIAENPDVQSITDANGIDLRLSTNKKTIFIDDTESETATFSVVASTGDDVRAYTFTLTVDAAPVWPASLGNHSVTQGEAFLLTLPVAIDSGDDISYALNNLPTGWEFNDTTHALTGAHNGASGTQNIEYLASDDHNTVTTTITITIDNALPEWEQGHTTNFDSAGGVQFLFTLPEADDVDSLVYEITTLPAGWTFNPVTQALSGAFATIAGGTEELEYLASDGDATITTSITLMFAGNDAPVWGALDGEFRHFTGHLGTFILPEATDEQELTYSVSKIPSGWTFHPTTRMLSSHSTNETVADVVYHATDGYFTITTTLSVTFSDFQSPGWEEGISALVGINRNAGGTIALPSATGDFGSNPTYSYKVSQGFSGIDDLPTGWTHNAATREISVASTAAENTYLFTYTASDDSATTEVTLTIAIADTPAWADGPISLEMLNGQAHVFLLPDPVSDYGINSEVVNSELVYDVNMQFEREINNLPAGLVFDAATGTLSGAYTGTESQLAFQYTVTDLIGAASVSVTIDVVDTLAWAEDGVVLSAMPGTYHSFNYALDDPVTELGDKRNSPLTLYDVDQHIIAEGIGYHDADKQAYVWDVLTETTGTYVVLPTLPSDSSLSGTLTYAAGTQPVVKGEAVDVDLGYSLLGRFGQAGETEEFIVYGDSEKFFHSVLRTDFAAPSEVTIMESYLDPNGYYTYMPAEFGYSFGGNNTTTSLRSYIHRDFLSPLAGQSLTSYTLSPDAPEFLQPFQVASTIFLPSGGTQTVTLSADLEDTDYVLSFNELQFNTDPNQPALSDPPTASEIASLLEYYYYDSDAAGRVYDDQSAGSISFNIFPDFQGNYFLPDGTTSTTPAWSGDLPVLQFRLALYPGAGDKFAPFAFTISSAEDITDEASDTHNLIGELDVKEATFDQYGAVFEFSLDVADIATMAPDGYMPYGFEFTPATPYRLELLGFAESDDPALTHGSLLDWLDAGG